MSVLEARLSAGEPASCLVGVTQVAGMLGVHPETVRRLIRDGRLEAIRIGRVLRVDARAVDAFIAHQRVRPVGD